MPTYDASQLEVRVKFNAGLDADKSAPKQSYDVIIAFDDVDDAVKCGARFVTWNLQRMARAGNLTNDRTIRVNSKGEYEKTLAEKLAHLSDDELAAEIARRRQATNV